MAKHHFHLAWFLSQGYGPKSWRSMWPGSDTARWMMPDIFVDLAKGLERGCFDYMIIEDSSMVPYTYKGSHDTYLKYGASAPKLDPAVLVPWLAMATKHLGLVPTLSISEYPPYLMARLVNSLDHVTEGRIGWNCVTGSNDGAAQNYGYVGQRPHDERYDVADEFADVVTRLWEAGDEDAVVLDPSYPDVRRRSQGPADQPRGQVLQGAGAHQRPALAAGSRPDLPGRWLAARPAVCSALGRHDHHQRHQRRGDEGLSRGRAPAGRWRGGATRTASRCCSSPIRSSTRRWRPRVSAASASRRNPGGTSTCSFQACRASPTSISRSSISMSRCRRASRPMGISRRSPNGSARRRVRWRWASTADRASTWSVRPTMRQA
jgi:alkanesulfonate monooxygenase SsuD/methylene tetrahydromethanopterin reductase-like flavin-dependent oxidoreductase (luciferase family)